MYLSNKWLNPELFGPSTPCCSRAIKKRVPLQGTVPGWVTSPWGLVEFRRCRLTNCCLQSPETGMHVPGIPQLSLEHIRDKFSLAPCPTSVWVYLWKCVTAMEGIKWPWWQWEPPFSLHPNTCCLCTPAGSHHHAVLSPLYNEMLWGSPPCRQPACSQGKSALRDHFRQHCHALQHSLARPASKRRKSVLVKHHIWSGATSTKHWDALLFRRVLPLKRCRGLGWIFLNTDWRHYRYHLVSQWVTETRERQFTGEIKRSN